MRNRSNIHNMRMPDGEVWRAMKQGDEQALECIFQRYYGDLYNYGMKLTGTPNFVEDHIQDLFLKIWTNRQQLGDVTGVKTYLWTALRRRLIAESQQNIKHEKQLEDNATESQPMQFSVEELIVRHEQSGQQSRELKKALNRLSPKRREALYLKYYGGMSYQEIEQIMGISYQTARNYVHKGLEALRGDLDKRSLVSKPTATVSLVFVVFILSVFDLFL